MRPQVLRLSDTVDCLVHQGPILRAPVLRFFVRSAMSIYTLAPLAGPALGPIAGGFIAENTSWRWVCIS